MTGFNWPTRKGNELYPDTSNVSSNTHIEIVPSQFGNEQADFEAAQVILREHGGRIDQFVQQQRRGYSLSDNQLGANKNTHPEVDVRYTNQFGAEKIHLRVYPQPPGGGEQEVLTLTTPCLMVLYGDDKIAAIPMSQLKHSTKFHAVHKGKVKARYGDDIILTAQYRFTKKSCVVFWPINIDKHELTVEKNYYLTSVAGKAAFADTRGSAPVDELRRRGERAVDSVSGTAFKDSVKSQLPRSTDLPNIDKPMCWRPIINGSESGKTVYTPLDTFKIDDHGKIEIDNTAPGDGKTLPYVIDRDGEYYYAPHWSSIAFSLVSLDLGPEWRGSEDLSYARPASVQQAFIDATILPIPPYTFGTNPCTREYLTYDTITAVGYFVKNAVGAPLELSGVETARYTTIADIGAQVDKYVPYLRDPFDPDFVNPTATVGGPGVHSPDYGGDLPFPAYESNKQNHIDTLTTDSTVVNASDDTTATQISVVVKLTTNNVSDASEIISPPYPLIVKYTIKITHIDKCSGQASMSDGASQTFTLELGGDEDAFNASIVAWVNSATADAVKAGIENINSNVTIPLGAGAQTLSIFDTSLVKPITDSFDPTVVYLEPFPPGLGKTATKAYYSTTSDFLNLDIHTPYEKFSGKKFQPWLHVSNGQHYIQGFQVDDESHLYCNSKDITHTLPEALGVGIGEIKTMVMDVPLSVIKKLH